MESWLKLFLFKKNYILIALFLYVQNDPVTFQIGRILFICTLSSVFIWVLLLHSMTTYCQVYNPKRLKSPPQVWGELCGHDYFHSLLLISACEMFCLWFILPILNILPMKSLLMKYLACEMQYFYSFLIMIVNILHTLNFENIVKALCIWQEYFWKNSKLILFANFTNTFFH